MGFNASIIIVGEPGIQVQEPEILREFGLSTYELTCETTLEECMWPGDGSINIGYFRDNIVICDDLILVETLDNLESVDMVAPYERQLCRLFPGSEVLTAVCMSATNFHLYALARDGKRKRFKSVSSENPVAEWGERLEEENIIYARSTIIDGKRLFKNDRNENEQYKYLEDQMMEDFTFGVAKRLLGVMISHEEDEELMFATTFRKYTKASP
ncbi:MAG: hypothetical protein Q8938_11705 [Bacteroidota bacterium]|nr:hypothetical protein [Bacteroidota bacterium]